MTVSEFQYFNNLNYFIFNIYNIEMFSDDYFTNNSKYSYKIIV